MSKTNETRIDAARAVVTGIQAEIDTLRAALRDAQHELATLSGDVGQLDADAVTRRAALAEVVENLLLRLPRQNLAKGASRPILQARLEQAEATLERVRSERFRLALEIAEIEAEADAWGDGTPAEVEAALALVYQTCARLGTYPPGANERMLSGWRFWARSVRKRIESLPSLRARLESFGEDPDYEPPMDIYELERAWQGPRMKLTFMRERLNRLGVSI